MSLSQTTVDPRAPVAQDGGADDRREAERCVDTGHHLSRQGRWREAESLYRKAIELRPGLAIAHNNLGWVRQVQGDSEGAVACYRRALQIEPGLPIAQRNLALLLVRLGRYEESLDLWYAEMLTGAEGHAWADEVITKAMEERELTLAGEYAELFARIRWGTQWYPLRRDGAGPQLPPLAPPVFLSIPKLLHDVEQFIFLQGRGVFGDELTPFIKEYERTAERLSPQGVGARVPLDDEARRAIGHIYNRIIHVRHTPRVSRTLSAGWDAAAVESQYLDKPPGVAVVDDFLSAEALEELRLFCMESTVWSANRYEHGRLGAFLREGFNCPLLLQIAEELREALPRVIGDRYPLRQLWGFKNDHTLPADSTTHADFAAVNVNFWITPDEANLDETSGGLVIYELDAPLEWDFSTYNGRSSFLRSYIQQRRAHAITIPYRQNRAVIFNSDLFHTTAAVRFRPGYENRRMNITMLYGHRENDAHHVRLGREDETPGPGAWRSASFSRARGAWR